MCRDNASAINGLLGVGIALQHLTARRGGKARRKTARIQNGQKRSRKVDFLVRGEARRGEEWRRIPFYALSSLLRASLANILPAYHGTNVLTEALRPPSSCPMGNCARQ